MSELTIISPHYNDIKELLLTINSIKLQTYKKWELIIIDSFTPNLLEKLSDQIKNDNRIEIIQKETGIYDAMNLGILNVNTPYFQILNSGTKYFSNETLESAMEEIENLSKKYGPMVHSFKTELINQNKVKKLKYSRFIYPFNSSHEGKINPTRMKNRILHYHKYKVAADANFDLDYADKYKVFFHKKTIIKYPKGGYSDSKYLFYEKIQCYFLLIIKTISLGRFGCTFYLLNRILKDIIIKLNNDLKR